MVTFSPVAVVSVKPEEDRLVIVPTDPPAAGPEPAGRAAAGGGRGRGAAGGGRGRGAAGGGRGRGAAAAGGHRGDHGGRGRGRDDLAVVAGKHVPNSCRRDSCSQVLQAAPEMLWKEPGRWPRGCAT